MSFERLISTVLADLRRYAMSLCGSVADADDLVQETVLRAIQSPGAPTDARHLKPWMFRVLRNVHIDHFRRRKLQLDYSARQRHRSDDVQIVPSSPIDDLVVRQAFESLPPEKQEILLLVDVMGMTYDETAEILDIARGTVMSRVSRARRSMADLLTDDQAQSTH